MSVFALIHSPIVGPSTWSLLAEELRRRGGEVAVPDLDGVEGGDEPYWRQHARAAARALRAVPAGRPPILVAHSGAGQLLPAIRQELGRPVAAYLFMDAGVPEAGQPRHGAGEFADYLRELYARGGRYPDWSDEALRELVPGSATHPRQLIAPRPQPFAYWEEVVPVFAGWPDAPCGYLQFSGPYDRAGARARREGWPYRRLDAGHFHMLVDPAAVADALTELVQAMPAAWGG
jgi:hypothetical protein